MSGKSKEEIAFELVSKLKGVGVWGENNRSEILDMYAECLEATSGFRSVNGKTPAALLMKEQMAAAPAQQPVAAQRPPAPQAPVAPPAPVQPPAQPPVQPPVAQQPQVRQQQQMVQQAYQQQVQPPR